MTTPADGAATAAAFGRGKRVLIANSFHVNALPHARSGCAAEIARHFIASLEPGDASCAAEVPPVRLVPRFAARIDALDPAIAEPGNAASDRALQLASAAVQTVGDILVRAAVNSSGHGAGLRGGRFEIAPGEDSRRTTLDRVRWTDDLAVSGTIDEARDAAGSVHAKLTIEGPDEIRGALEVRWEDRKTDAQARIRGEIAGRAVEAQHAGAVAPRGFATTRPPRPRFPRPRPSPLRSCAPRSADSRTGCGSTWRNAAAIGSRRPP